MMERIRKSGRAFLALAAAIALAAAVLAGCAGCAGAGPVAKSVADRLLPTSQRTVWARCPAPGTHADSYRDASGSYTNYVYDVEAADCVSSRSSFVNHHRILSGLSTKDLRISPRAAQPSLPSCFPA